MVNQSEAPRRYEAKHRPTKRISQRRLEQAMQRARELHEHADNPPPSRLALIRIHMPASLLSRVRGVWRSR